MAEVNKEILEESPLPEKRKSDLECMDEDDNRKKIKPEISSNNPPVVDEKPIEDEGDGDDEEDDDDEDEDEEGKHLNGKSVIDDKGKGIMKEEKGKGKLKAGDGSDDDDSSDGEGHSDDDSDLSDDPLAEVDLDNILPSRTRRRAAQPGAYLVNDLDKDDDDSDDADALLE